MDAFDDEKALVMALSSLDSDLIDLDDREGLEDAAYVAAANICRGNGADVGRFAQEIRDALDGGDNNRVAVFLSQATNVDWLFDDKANLALRFVLNRLLNGIEHYSDSDGEI